VIAVGLFASLVARNDAGTVVAECRRCGTTVDAGTSVCATCGSEDIVRYEID
jgi:ribosomal protein L37E